MAKNEYTEARARANRKWNEKNKDRTRYLNARSAARSFIRNRSTVDDLKELRELIDQREADLKE
ncbi:MAG: hypothetical protein LKH74_11500 [Levilactobacillus sp.]|jgi:hypothetical protein|nr:hypothetical protein [Levilactobacillus sp.]MCH4124181.1 hypothetical protein [Levilactobacillus sp.]MCI1554534.1 hypothetical protein [Levilactobacillus sp.]MCI1598375.1 hypothetical protein [Levilactobacillus sp.]MCI1605841.1 hypothetical protein [Levilactobacillus sp.]